MNQQAPPAAKSTSTRPSLFRALGKAEPPPEIEIEGKTYQHERTIKHDSWAATATYMHGDQRVVCKFNRIQPILLLPTRWLGRRLAQREADMYARLSDLPNISTGYRDVFSDGKRLPNAVAHDFIDGHPLRWHDSVDDTFFEKLRETIQEIHRRDIAYVDLNKWENIIVMTNGDPALIDFQISVRLTGKFWPVRSILRVLQQCDLYHVAKHASRIRPDLYSDEVARVRPWWIRMHRKIANPFRAFRRRTLVWFGVRRGKGRAQSETFVEEGLRETADGNPEIMKLYKLIKSDAFQQRAKASSEGHARHAFASLVGRLPQGDAEIQFVERLQESPLHEQIVGLLRSRPFYFATSSWDSDTLTAIAKRIEMELGTSVSGEPNVRRAA